MMIGCVIGRDRAEVSTRIDTYRAITGKPAPPIFGTVDEVVETLRRYAAAGVDRTMLQHLDHEDAEMVGVLGEVADELRDAQ